MNWLLIVLQATAVSTISGYNNQYNRYGYTTLGEFQTEQACRAASVKLAEAAAGAPGVKSFHCIERGK